MQVNQLSVKNPIYCAVEKRDYDSLKTLLGTAKFDEVNDKRLTNKSALDLAVRRGDEIATKLLLEYGAEPDYNRSMSTWSQSTLGRAIRSGNRKVIKMLIDAGCNPDNILDISSRSWFHQAYSYNCWFKLIELHNMPAFQFLLECMQRQVCNDEWGRKLLFIACRYGSTEIVRYLLDHGVPIDSIGELGETGAFEALDTSSHHISTFQLLVARGTNLRHTNSVGFSLLHMAVVVGASIELIRQLLDCGLDVNSCDTFKRTPLHHAVRESTNIAIVKLLLERGADINAIDKYGYTPIHTALMLCFNDYKVVNLLFQQKNISLVQPEYQHGITILHRMVLKNNTSILRNTILRPEVNINVPDKKGKTPLVHLIEKNQFFHFALLIDFGAETKVLHNFREDLLKNKSAMSILAIRQLKRKIAGFDKDPNIVAILYKQNVLSMIDTKKYIKAFSKEIKMMKTTFLFGQLTYYYFLFAKKRVCCAVSSKPEMKKIFVEQTHKFYHYSNMLSNKYLQGLRPLTTVEAEALKNAEENLNFIFNFCLPSLIIYKIKRYIDIEDMITLQNLN